MISGSRRYTSPCVAVVPGIDRFVIAATAITPSWRKPPSSSTTSPAPATPRPPRRPATRPVSSVAVKIRRTVPTTAFLQITFVLLPLPTPPTATIVVTAVKARWTTLITAPFVFFVGTGGRTGSRAARRLRVVVPIVCSRRLFRFFLFSGRGGGLSVFFLLNSGLPFTLTKLFGVKVQKYLILGRIIKNYLHGPCLPGA